MAGEETALRLNAGRLAICRAVKRAEADETLIAAGGALRQLGQIEISQQ